MRARQDQDTYRQVTVTEPPGRTRPPGARTHWTGRRHRVGWPTAGTCLPQGGDRP
ncbi:MAG TPA: hypothetical protein VNF47_10015 [Streptosporangiaceae bacterium]|nr:hypothetical protein [Streptosporangiaceae bacterium]